MSKERLDVLLAERGLAPSRERAKSAIMAGLVFVDGVRIDKAGTLVPAEAKILVQGDSIGYVSRGGLKLAKAIEEFGLDLAGLVVADIGASTGGFTDCALKNKAAKVYAIDVGYGQLAWSLRTDNRVVNLERTNIRYVLPEHLGEQLDFATIDVAFISLEKILPAVKNLLKPSSRIIALIKPQFEAGRENVEKKGVVKEPKIHAAVIEKIINTAKIIGFAVLGLTYSPIKGPEGNIEYLLFLAKNCGTDNFSEEKIGSVVAAAHGNL